MVKTTDKILFGILVVVLVASSGALITALSTQGTQDSQNPVELQLNTQSSLSMAEAQNIAMLAVNGIVTDVSLIERYGTPVYEVEIMNGGKETDVLIHPKTGRVISIEIEEDEEELTEQELEKINGLITKEQAYEIAQEHIGGGKVVDFESEIEGGLIVFEISLTLSGEHVEVEIDAHTGVVIEVEYGEDDDD